MSKPPHIANCEVCLKDFEATHPLTKVCSDECRKVKKSEYNKAYQKARRLEIKENGFAVKKRPGRHAKSKTTPYTISAHVSKEVHEFLQKQPNMSDFIRKAIDNEIKRGEKNGE